MASITTNSPSSKNNSSTTTELLLTASALNGSLEKSSDSFQAGTPSDSFLEKVISPSSSSSYSRSFSDESNTEGNQITSTRLQYNSNLESKEVDSVSNFLKMSPSNYPTSSSSSANKNKEPGTDSEANPAEENANQAEPDTGKAEQDEEEDEEQFSTQSTLNRNENDNENDIENDGDLVSVSESSQSYSHAFTDSTFHTPSSSLHNLAKIFESESPSQEIIDDVMSVVDTEDFKLPENSPADETLNPTSGIDISPETPTTSGQSTSSINKTPIGSPYSEFSQSLESNNSRDYDFVSSGNSDNRTNKETLLQPGNYNAKPTKKKMWYHVFTPSYKSRVGDFRKNFKDLPTEERLIVDYSCALQKDILVQGRMFVSQNYVCFHANILGWETQTLIRFKNVISITKEKTALVIPNAIQVSTDTEKYFFASFVTRDSAFVMLFKLWQSSLLDHGLSPREIWKLVRASYGDELGISSEVETEDYLSISPGTNLVKAASISTLMSSTSEADDNKSIEIDLNHDIPSDSNYHESEVLSNGIRRRADLSDSSDSETEIEIRVGDKDKLSLEIPNCPVDHSNQGKELVNAIIPCDVDTLFTMLFTNSKFYLDFHTARKTFDISQSEWEESADETRKVRQVSFTVTLNQVMGPKHSQLSETQTMLPISKPGRLYAIDCEAVNSGIPYADAFYVPSHFCLSRVSAHQSRLIILSQIKYRKSIWGITKSFIEKNSWIGMTEFYNHLELALKEECLKSATSPPPSPRLGSMSTGPVRRIPPRKKYPAPAIPADISAAKLRTGSLGRSTIPPSGSSLGDEHSAVPDGSFLLKVILTILAGLLLINAFLYIKLSHLETATATPSIFSVPRVSFSQEMPQTHQEWLVLLQKQESLHRLELQKWHDILLSALNILKQAEMDLESLKSHVTAYNDGHGNILKETPMFHRTPSNSENSKSAEVPSS